MNKLFSSLLLSFLLIGGLSAQTTVSYIPPNPGIAELSAARQPNALPQTPSPGLSPISGVEGATPAPTPGAEPGCAVNARGSAQELACEEASYRKSASLRNFISFMGSYQSLTCNGITAQKSQSNNFNVIDLTDPNGIFRIAYNQQQVLIPGGVQSTYLWMTREKVLQFLQGCKQMGYPVHFPLPEPVQRARTTGDY